jgi:hypothetical protein
MYLATATRPDLSFPGSQLARYMTNPTMEHLAGPKHSLRYLGSTRLILQTVSIQEGVLLVFC